MGCLLRRGAVAARCNARLVGRVPPLVVALSVLALWLVDARSGVDAHAELVRADPAPDALLAVPPERIELWLSEPIDAGEGSPGLRVLDGAGRELLVSDLGVDPDDPRHVSAAVADLANGAYTVVWTARSATDGHTLSGDFAFRVGGGRLPGAASVEGETPAVWAVATRWLTFFGAALATGGFLAVLYLAPGAAADRRTAWLVLAGLLIGLLATLAEPVLQTLDPPAGTTAPTLGEAVRALPDAWWLRPGALVAMLPIAVGWVAMTARSRRLPGVAAGLGLTCALAALLGLSLTSHAAGRESWRSLAVASNVLHQWAVALWVGGLAHLALQRVARRGATEVTAIEPVRRFSPLALGLVAVALVTGTVNAGFVLPALRELWESDYGRILIAKIALLVPPLLLATFHRAALRRAVGELGAALRGTVRAEAALVLVVVLGGSTLALLAPPVAGRVGEATVGPTTLDFAAPYDPTQGDTGPLLHLVVGPLQPGEQEVAVRVSEPVPPGTTGPTRSLPPDTEVDLTFTSLNNALEPMHVAAEPDGTGGYALSGVRLNLDGWWRIDVRVRPPGQTGVRQAFYVLLPDPNAYGAGAVAVDEPSAEAEAIYDRGRATYTSLHRVRYTERVLDGDGGVAIAEYAVADGSDGRPPAYSAETARVGLVQVGDEALIRTPDGAWRQTRPIALEPPSAWDREWAGATDFRLGRVEEVAGEPSRIVTLFVPESERLSAAWYAMWIGEESGRIHRLAMVARSHYMVEDFRDFDAPFTIELPVPAASPAATPPAS